MGAFLRSLAISLPSAILAVEVALASPLAELLRTLMTHSRKSARLVTSKRISDHWKERILPVYAITMLRASVLALFWLLLIFAAFAVGLYAAGWAFDTDFEGIAVLARLDYMLAAFFSAIAYLILRRWLRNVRIF